MSRSSNLLDEFRNPTEESGNLPSLLVLQVEDATFRFDDNYLSGEQLVLALSGKVIESDVELGEDEDTRFWSCGKGWDTEDNGRTATHDNKQKFDPRSGVGRLLDRVCRDKSDGGLGLADQMAERAKETSRESGIWKGLILTLEREEIDYGKDIGKKAMLLPTKVDFGDGGNGSKTSGKGKSKGKSKANDDEDAPKKSKSKFDPDTFISDLTKAARKALTEAASEADDAEEFVDAALEIEDIETDDQKVLVANAQAIFDALSDDEDE